MDFYLLNRRELGKNEVTGQAISTLEAFIKKHFSDDERKKGATCLVELKQLKKLEKSCPDIIDDTNIFSKYVAPHKIVAITPRTPIISKKSVIVDLFNKGYTSEQIAEETGFALTTVEVYRCNYTKIRKTNVQFGLRFEITCIRCGTKKIVYPYRKKQKYCSVKCKNEAFSEQSSKKGRKIKK